VLLVIVFSTVMIYRVCPRYGRKNPLIYISICSTVGSVSIMAVKGVGIAVKLTLGGYNQFTHPSTYVFILVTVVCILTQMNYFNKALSQFNTNMYANLIPLPYDPLLTSPSVNPLYYVTFTTCTLVASFILFQGFNTSDAVNTISLLCGFLIIFTGVYLLNLSREDPEGHNHMQLNGNGSRFDLDGIPTDPMSGPLTRRSMQARRSSDAQRRRSNSINLSFASRRSGDDGGREALMHNYDVEATNGGFSLGDLADSDDEGVPRQNGKAKVSHERLSFNKTGR
jgi:hypothetical protein